MYFGDLRNFLGCHPSQGFRWALNKIGWVFFTVFDISGVGVFHHVNQHRVVVMVFPRSLGVAVFPPCVGGFAGGWPSPTEGLAA